MGLCATLQTEVAHELTALIGPGAVDAWDLGAVETAARRLALRLAARAVAQRLNIILCGSQATECAR